MLPPMLLLIEKHCQIWQDAMLSIAPATLVNALGFLMLLCFRDLFSPTFVMCEAVPNFSAAFGNELYGFPCTVDL